MEISEAHTTAGPVFTLTVSQPELRRLYGAVDEETRTIGDEAQPVYVKSIQSMRDLMHKALVDLEHI